MRKLLATIIATALVAGLVTSVRAEEITLKGEAVCAKCELHKTDKCQTAIRVKEDGKEVIYFATDNAVAKEFHHNICQAPAKVVATGNVKEKDGKKLITLKKIEVQ